MKIGTKDYPVIGQVEIRGSVSVPLVDIPMMSDEKWNQLARENAMRNYRREFGKEPDTPEQAEAWQLEQLNSIKRNI